MKKGWKAGRQLVSKPNVKKMLRAAALVMVISAAASVPPLDSQIANNLQTDPAAKPARPVISKEAGKHAALPADPPTTAAVQQGTQSFYSTVSRPVLGSSQVDNALTCIPKPYHHHSRGACIQLD